MSEISISIEWLRKPKVHRKVHTFYFELAFSPWIRQVKNAANPLFMRGWWISGILGREIPPCKNQGNPPAEWLTEPLRRRVSFFQYTEKYTLFFSGSGVTVL